MVGISLAPCGVEPKNNAHLHPILSPGAYGAWPGDSWGSLYSTAGNAQRYAHWYYLGSSLALAADGNQYHSSGRRVDVYLVDGHVVGWVDYTPSEPRSAE